MAIGVCFHPECDGIVLEMDDLEWPNVLACDIFRFPPCLVFVVQKMGIWTNKSILQHLGITW